MDAFWNWLKKQPWWIKLIVGIAGVIAMVWGTFNMQSCSVNHKVIQSSYNTTTGDSIVIRYEQTGRMRK